MMGNAVDAIEPGGAHGASLGLALSVHQMIDDQRTIGLSEKFAEADGARRRVTSREVAWPLFKRIVLNRSALREVAAHLGDAFALAHELDFGEAKLLALGQIVGRFVG